MTIHEKRAGARFAPGPFKAERLRRWAAWREYRRHPTIANALKVHYPPWEAAARWDEITAIQDRIAAAQSRMSKPWFI